MQRPDITTGFLILDDFFVVVQFFLKPGIVETLSGVPVRILTQLFHTLQKQIKHVVDAQRWRYQYNSRVNVAIKLLLEAHIENVCSLASYGTTRNTKSERIQRDLRIRRALGKFVFFHPRDPAYDFWHLFM